MVGSQKILKWYHGLRSRTVDLVGDYAGDELFIVDGDSLLLQAFSDETLDFSVGFQLLHAAYIVEKLLFQLHSRKCNFHIIFFTANAQSCVPFNACQPLQTRYLLARECIIQHLLQNLPTAIPSIEVKCFETYQSEAFRTHLGSVGAYFFMCHDGAGTAVVDVNKARLPSGNILDPSEDVDISITSPSGRIILRTMIHRFVSWGYNIALINNLECRDTKVMAMIVEGSAEKAKQLFGTNSAGFEGTDDSDSFDSDDIGIEPDHKPGSLDMTNANPLDIAQTLRTIKERGQDLTQRDMLVVYTVILMFKEGIISNTEMLEARAMLLLTTLLHEYQLRERAIDVSESPKDQHYFFLNKFIQRAKLVLETLPWQVAVSGLQALCDMADLLDGRMFLEIARALQQSDLEHTFKSPVLVKFKFLALVVREECGLDLNFEQPVSDESLAPCSKNDAAHVGTSEHREAKAVKSKDKQKAATAVLPFSHPVLDTHLRPISLVVDKSANGKLNIETARIFQELSHWHNHRRLLKLRGPPQLTEKQIYFANRRNQFFMAEMRRYAASLTNAAGGILKPETVFVLSARDRQQKQVQESKSPIGDLGKESKSSKGTRNTLKNTSKDNHSSKAGKYSAIIDQAAAAHQKKVQDAIDSHIKAWTFMMVGFDKVTEPVTRFRKAKEYLVGLPKDKRSAVEAEVLTYLINILMQLWADKCGTNERNWAMSIVALIWHTMCDIAKLKQSVTAEIATCITNTIKVLHLPNLKIQGQGERRLSFKFMSLLSDKVALDIELSPIEFQLLHTGPYLDRNMGSAPDPRVRDFEPDKWQRDVLDQIDAKKSVFVVAPTSAGKTFISFYAMKEVLNEDDNGVLVYVAPTKALVNQIAAEIQARFSKTFKHSAGKSVWAIHTRDYRINNPTGCQVLVTVPHILQIMLLAPSNANSWSSRVKRIIFDEIHCIGQSDDGVVWEQLLLLAPCPIIALSATVGNPREFKNWLSLTQKANRIDLEMIEHQHRYSDLRKYIYHPPEQFIFNGVSESKSIAILGLDHIPGMAFLHPVASLIDRSRGMPDDFSLEPRDCWTLWNAMKKHQTADYPVDQALDPTVALPHLIRKADVIEWGARLKALLRTWLIDYNSPFDALLGELGKDLRSKPLQLQISSAKLKGIETPAAIKMSKGLDTILPLICSLNDQGALPALIFNYDRSRCEKICQYLLMQLQEAEHRWKASSAEWKAKIAGWEAWKRNQEKLAKVKVPKKSTKKEMDDDENMSRADRMRDTASVEASPYESFNPHDPVAGFHLADMKKLSSSEFEEYAKELRYRLVPEWLITALKRGIGVHHAGMNRRYRQVCEMLFRKGYLRVVVATGTLALGINMPCKTVVFSGDSIFLTALSFRQAAGRAGRRGFDMLGNVVFHGVPYAKVCRLLSSRLPDLNGHFPITTSLVLRLFILLHESKQAPYAVKAVNSMLSCPRLYLGGPESRHTVLHHLRFSIEYLRRNHLLDASGAPLNFAGCISHLYYTENASFAFHALLSAGYFHRLCESTDRSPKQVLLTLMLIMSHLFCRHNLRPSFLESHRRADKFSSIVVLPSLPRRAASVLRNHNEETLNIYSAYVSTFIDQHVKKTDCYLPLTGMKCGGDKVAQEISTAMSILPPTHVNSAFVALSGHRDEWKTISSLCKMVRSEVWLEQAVVPYVGVYPEEGKEPLNAYLYDFFKHGNVHALEHENGIRKGDIWFVLNEFSLVLATIVTSFENYLKLSPGTDNDMLDVMGQGDAHEGEVDEDFITLTPSASDTFTLPTRSKPDPASSHPSPVQEKAKKTKVAESWDEEMDDDTPNGDEDETTDDEATLGSSSGGRGMLKVLDGFKLLQTEFNVKFKAMWA